MCVCVCVLWGGGGGYVILLIIRWLGDVRGRWGVCYIAYYKVAGGVCVCVWCVCVCVWVVGGWVGGGWVGVWVCVSFFFFYNDNTYIFYSAIRR